MERQIKNSIAERYIFPEVRIGTFKHKVGGRYEYQTIFVTYLRVKRESDNTWFLVAFEQALYHKKNIPEVMNDWIVHSYQEAYRALLVYKIPADDDLDSMEIHPFNIRDSFKGEEVERIKKINEWKNS